MHPANTRGETPPPASGVFIHMRPGDRSQGGEAGLPVLGRRQPQLLARVGDGALALAGGAAVARTSSSAAPRLPPVAGQQQRSLGEAGAVPSGGRRDARGCERLSR